MKLKRLLAVGCSHGNCASPQAIAAVLKFREAWKPDLCVHLGDFLDTACFRSGSAGTSDEAERPEPDVQEGLDFLKQLRPNVVLCGNHEDRLWKLRNHPKAIVAALAASIVQQIENRCALMKARLVPYSYKAWHDEGNIRFMHGEFFNEMACRDHAEAYAPMGGTVIFAHTHKTMMMHGRRHDNPVAYCVGTLTEMENLDYAHHRRSSLSWAGGFAWGLYNEKESTLWLHQNGQRKEWTLPPV